MNTVVSPASYLIVDEARLGKSIAALRTMSRVGLAGGSIGCTVPVKKVRRVTEVNRATPRRESASRRGAVSCYEEMAVRFCGNSVAHPSLLRTRAVRDCTS
jgi:hypothetical protein